MPEFAGFCGPSNRQQSPTANAEWTVNLFARAVGAGTPKSEPALYRRPAIRLFAYGGAGPGTAIFAQDGRAFAVIGSVFWEILPSANLLARGYVNPSPIQATISSSGKQGHQLFITSGGSGWIYDLIDNSFTKITDDAFPSVAVMGLYFNAAFIVLSGTDGKFLVSGLFDGLSWNALDAGIEIQFSDQIISILRNGDNLMLGGSRNTALWVDAGAGGAAGFIPQPGTIISHGVVAPFTVIQADNTAWWLGQDKEGAKMFWRLDGYTPLRVSTAAVEFDIARVGSQISNSIACAMQIQGETFIVLYIPGLDTTWVYALSVQMWFEWGHWIPKDDTFIPWRITSHAYAFGKHLGLDRLSGAIYEIALVKEGDLVV